MPKPELSIDEPADERHRRAPEHGQPDVVDHLPLVVLVDGHRPAALRRLGNGLAGKGNQRDRPGEADALTRLAQLAHRVADEARRRAERDDDHLGVVAPAASRCAAARRRASASVLATPVGVVLGQVVADALALLGASRARRSAWPRRCRRSRRSSAHSGRGGSSRIGGQLDRLVGVGEEVVAEQQHRIAPAQRHVDRVDRQLRRPR